MPIITTRVRSTREGNVFTGVCGNRGVPHSPVQGRGLPYLVLAGGKDTTICPGRGDFPIPGGALSCLGVSRFPQRAQATSRPVRHLRSRRRTFLLPPASVGWGKYNSFSILVCPHPGGVPTLTRSRRGVPTLARGYPKVGTPGQDREGGTPR